jgi:ribonuclease P protein component
MERLRQRAEFLAVAAGAKVPAAAVERNRVRRRLKEAVRRCASRDMRPGHDYVIVGRRAALSLDFARLVDDLQRSLGRVHARRSPQPRRAGEVTTGAAEDSS